MHENDPLHFINRIHWAYNNLEPVQSEYCIIYEDDSSEPVKITVPAPEWMAMAVHGNLLPPISAYEKVKYGCWKSNTKNYLLYVKIEYCIAAINEIRNWLSKSDITKEEYIEKTELLKIKLVEYENLISNFTGGEPDEVFVGLDGERKAQDWIQKNQGFYRVMNYNVIHYAKPIGPMTQEEAIEYILQKDVPTSVWKNSNGSNQRKFIITRRENIPSKNTLRNAWTINQIVKEEEYA